MCVTIIKERGHEVEREGGICEEWRVWGGNNVTIVLMHEILKIIMKHRSNLKYAN